MTMYTPHLRGWCQPPSSGDINMVVSTLEGGLTPVLIRRVEASSRKSGCNKLRRHPITARTLYGHRMGMAWGWVYLHGRNASRIDRTGLARNQGNAKDRGRGAGSHHVGNDVMTGHAEDLPRMVNVRSGLHRLVRGLTKLRTVQWNAGERGRGVRARGALNRMNVTDRGWENGATHRAGSHHVRNDVMTRHAGRGRGLGVRYQTGGHHVRNDMVANHDRSHKSGRYHANTAASHEYGHDRRKHRLWTG
jgi:hypothetical protein